MGWDRNLHEYLQEMNQQVISKYDIMTVAEGAGSSFEDAIALVDPERHELNMAYHFEGMDIGNDPGGYSLVDFKRVYTRWDSALAEKGWVSIFLGNHDVPRMLTKFGNDRPPFRKASSKLLTTFIMTMRGTPYYYYGDELGMANIKFNKIQDYRDIATINGYKNVRKKGGNVQAFLEREKFISRDNARTPFQWDNSKNAGFTAGKPWIKVNPDYVTVNQATEEKDPVQYLATSEKWCGYESNYPNWFMESMSCLTGAIKKCTAIPVLSIIRKYWCCLIFQKQLPPSPSL